MNTRHILIVQIGTNIAIRACFAYLEQCVATLGVADWVPLLMGGIFISRRVRGAGKLACIRPNEEG